jgi:D-alanine-D-alanine ligase
MVNKNSALHSKIKVGILFGGNSREREVSFAGGRTVYDLLNKSIFEPIPIFVDSFGQLVELDWPFLYKGSIRDFYPPSASSNFPSPNQVFPSSGAASPSPWLPYAEQIDNAHQFSAEWRKAIGKPLVWEDLSHHIDVVFLALHGKNGEDGRVQSMLDYWGIPYTGCGAVAAAWGMNKVSQRRDMLAKGWDVPKHLYLARQEWVGRTQAEKDQWINRIQKEFPQGCVIKSANQGSSIGLTLLRELEDLAVESAINKAFFTEKIQKADYPNQGDFSLDRLADFRTGLGFPLRDLIRGQVWNSPSQWEQWFWHEFDGESCELESLDHEPFVLVEEIIVGKEFSCIVLQKPDGTPSALPPTEILSSQDFYDYRSKYLPGLARKKTPMDLPDSQIQQIRIACQALFDQFNFSVYARIDGFVTPEGRILLNDPNTTSGMMPSSFFFQQAAEIGLSPSAFLTYIVSASLQARQRENPGSMRCRNLGDELQHKIHQAHLTQQKFQRIGVLMGGYSSERHISVESGRNIYEKISSSEGMEAVSLFLSGDADHWQLHELPMHLHLKDNADDILAGIQNPNRPEILGLIQQEFRDVLKIFSPKSVDNPLPVNWNNLSDRVDFVFIALHGRPGEDGAVQARLDSLGIPYNGSGVASSSLTIDKYATGRLLSLSGLQVADQRLVTKVDWQSGSSPGFNELDGWPKIAKPLDDGCSTAVCKLTCREDLAAYAQLCFRKEHEWSMDAAHKLHAQGPEWFNRAEAFLLEEFVSAQENEYFLEITGAMLIQTRTGGEHTYEVFEPSESIAGAGILSLEEKFLAGQGTNITPARFAADPLEQGRILAIVQDKLRKAAEVAGVEGYCRIDAFVGIPKEGDIRVVIIEINSLPGMTPATCIFHQAALAGYTPHQFIARIIYMGFEKSIRR